MAAYDNISLGSAPGAGSYAAPLVNFGALSELPAAYQQGNQDARTRALQGAFREGLPRDAQGNLDIGKMSETLAKLGGADAAMPLINLGIQQQQNTTLANAIRNGAPSATDNQPTQQPTTIVVPAHGIPAGDSGVTTQRGQDQSGPITPQRLAEVQNQQPSNSGYRPETERVTGAAPEVGKNTLTGIATDAYGADRIAQVLPRLQAAFGVQDPNMPLEPDKMATIQRAIGGAAIQAGNGQPLTERPGGPGVGNVAQMNDPNVTALSRADQADREGRNFLAAAAGSLNLPAPQKEALEKAAQSRFDFAKQLRESVYKNQALTDAQKQYQADRQPGESQAAYEARLEGGKAGAKDRAGIYAKKYEKLVESGSKAELEIPQLSMIQSQMKDPNSNFYSGFGAKYAQIWNQLKAAGGYDPNAAFSMEAFGKVVSGNLLNSLGSVSEPGMGSLKLAMINIAKEANASQSFTPATNDFLIELSKRVHERNIDLATMASRYKDGVLDSGFDRMVQAYEKGKLAPQIVQQLGLSGKQGPVLSQPEIERWHEIRKEATRAPATGTTAGATGQAQQSTAPTEVTAVHPDGRVLVLRNGQWMPQQGAVPQPVPLQR